jgi:hypothetical protein
VSARKLDYRGIGALRPGDVVRNIGSGEAYVVLENVGRGAIAVRTIHVSNPQEWVLVSRGDWQGLAPEEREL